MYKMIRWGVNLLLTSGLIAAIGLLSYCGMLVIVQSIPLAWLAFILAGLVEGEVFKQNIAQGIEALRLLGSRGWDQLIIQAIDQALRDQATANDGQSYYAQFLRDYCEQKKRVAAFYHKKLTDQQKKQKKEEEACLRKMQEFLVLLVLNTSQTNANIVLPKSLAIVCKQLPTLKRKIWYIRFAMLLSIMAGIGFGFATASALHIAFISLSIASAPTIWPLAIIAFIGYSLLIYHTLVDMIQNETIQKWRLKVMEWFKHQPNENHFKYGLRATGVGLCVAVMLGLSIAATLATAGTWWVAIKEGVQLLPKIASIAAMIRNIIVPINFITGLCFVITNAVESIDYLIHHIHTYHPIAYLRQQWMPFWRGIKQDLLNNPFHWLAESIAYPFRAIVFWGHLIASGLMSDRSPGLNKAGVIASVVAGATVDGLVDYHYVMENDAHEHDHDHFLILDVFLQIGLSPLYCLAALWDGAKTNHTFKAAFAKQFEGFVKYCHVHHEAYAEPKTIPLSTAWMMTYRVIPESPIKTFGDSGMTATKRFPLETCGDDSYNNTNETITPFFSSTHSHPTGLLEQTRLPITATL